MSEKILSVRDLRVRYPRAGSMLGRRRDQDHPWAVDQVSFSVGRGESLALVGESGCGKSTLARVIVGLIRPTEGSVVIEGEEMGRNRTRANRRAVQLIFQDPYSSLNPRMTVGAAIQEALRVNQMRTGRAVEERTAELLNLVSLPSRLVDVTPGHLSGGQRQRVSIARALATEPRILVADEPVSALDVSVQAAVLNLFSDLRRELGLTLIMISHNLAVVRQVSEQVAVMRSGQLVETGTTDQVMRNPTHEYTRSLLASVPSLVPRTRRASMDPSPQISNVRGSDSP